MHLTPFYLLNGHVVHGKPVGFFNDVVRFKLSSVLVMALYQVQQHTLEIWAVKLRFLLIYENMLKSIATTRSECTAKLATLKILIVFCETIFGFLKQSANRDSKWFSDL